MNDTTAGPPTLDDLQAQALKPLIELMAESLAKGDEMGHVLLAWLETPEGEAAILAIAPDLLSALHRPSVL